MISIYESCINLVDPKNNIKLIIILSSTQFQRIGNINLSLPSTQYKNHSSIYEISPRSMVFLW